MFFLTYQPIIYCYSDKISGTFFLGMKIKKQSNICLYIYILICNYQFIVFLLRNMSKLW